jgi:hypothetical protein
MLGFSCSYSRRAARKPDSVTVDGDVAIAYVAAHRLAGQSPMRSFTAVANLIEVS